MFGVFGIHRVFQILDAPLIVTIKFDRPGGARQTREGQAGTGPPETGTADGTTGEEPTAEGVAGRETGGAEPGPERSEVTSPEKGPGESGARGREGGEGGLVFRRLRRSNR